MINALVVENFKQWNHTGFALSSCVACHVTPLQVKQDADLYFISKSGAVGSH
jgi:hypothetical protein